MRCEAAASPSGILTGMVVISAGNRWRQVLPSACYSNWLEIKHINPAGCRTFPEVF
jgi:hypothetical protein